MKGGASIKEPHQPYQHDGKQKTQKSTGFFAKARGFFTRGKSKGSAEEKRPLLGNQDNMHGPVGHTKNSVNKALANSKAMDKSKKLDHLKKLEGQLITLQSSIRMGNTNHSTYAEPASDEHKKLFRFSEHQPKREIEEHIKNLRNAISTVKSGKNHKLTKSQLEKIEEYLKPIRGENGELIINPLKGIGLKQAENLSGLNNRFTNYLGRRLNKASRTPIKTHLNNTAQRQELQESLPFKNIGSNNENVFKKPTQKSANQRFKELTNAENSISKLKEYKSLFTNVEEPTINIYGEQRKISNLTPAEFSKEELKSIHEIGIPVYRNLMLTQLQKTNPIEYAELTSKFTNSPKNTYSTLEIPIETIAESLRKPKREINKNNASRLRTQLKDAGLIKPPTPPPRSNSLFGQSSTMSSFTSDGSTSSFPNKMSAKDYKIYRNAERRQIQMRTQNAAMNRTNVASILARRKAINGNNENNEKKENNATNA